MSITTERRRLAEVGLVMREREDWGAVFDDYDQARPVQVAGLLVGHIAVVRDPGDLLGTEDQVMRNIERIGIARFPNTGYSYNGAAFNTGRLYEGQPLERRGAHTVNDRRRSSCTMSGCPSRGDSLTAPSWNNNVNARALVAPQMPGDPCTDAQVTSFARWGAALKLAGFATSAARWHGHRCFAAKDCPSNEVWLRLDDIADLTADYVRAGHVGGGSPEEDDMTPEQLLAALKDPRIRYELTAIDAEGFRDGPTTRREVQELAGAGVVLQSIGRTKIETGAPLTVGIALDRIYKAVRADEDPVDEAALAEHIGAYVVAHLDLPDGADPAALKQAVKDALREGVA
jgi:hypothetical protein